MSAGQASGTYIEILVRLLDEGVVVWRPVTARRVDGDVYVITSHNDDPDERWEFPPGARVVVARREFEGGGGLVAIAAAP